MSSPEHRDRRAADPGRVRLLEGHLTPAHGPLAAPAGGPSYRLRPSIEFFVDRHGDLCLVCPGGRDLIVRGPEPADIALVEQLARGPATAATLGSVGLDPPAVAEKLSALVAAGAVLDHRAPLAAPLEGEDAARFSRQLPYLAELGDEHALQRRLRAATVTVLGCGGVGTWAIAALACAGIGHLVLVDDDTVELSNLNRQVLYRRDDVGSAKVLAAAAWLRAFDPAVRVTTVAHRIAAAADVPPLTVGADAIVLAADWPPYEIARWVNAACVEDGTPFVVAGQMPPVLKVGPTYVPGDGACFACHEAALRRESPAYDDYVASRRAGPSTASTLGPASGVVGSLLGLELMHLLAGQRPATQDCALLVDVRTLEVRRHPVAREPGCPACEHRR